MKLPWPQSTVVHGADLVLVVGMVVAAQLHPWGALLLLTLLTCLWWGGKESSQGMRNACEVCNLSGTCAVTEQSVNEISPVISSWSRVKPLVWNQGLVIGGSFYKVFYSGCFPTASLLPQSPLNSAARKELHQCVAGYPRGRPALPAGRMQTAEGVFPGVRLSLRPCSRLPEKEIKDNSKLLSACLFLPPRYSYLSAERICPSLGLLFSSARDISSKCQGSMLVCNPPAASECLVWWPGELEATSEVLRPHWCLGEWLERRQTRRAVIPAGSRQISWHYNHSRKAGNCPLFWSMPLVWERGCVCISMKWIWGGAAVYSSWRLSGFPPSWRLCSCIWYDRHGGQ